MRDPLIGRRAALPRAPVEVQHHIDWQAPLRDSSATSPPDCQIITNNNPF